MSFAKALLDLVRGREGTMPIEKKTYRVKNRRGHGIVGVNRVKNGWADCFIIHGEFSGPKREKGDWICLEVGTTEWIEERATADGECQGK